MSLEQLKDQATQLRRAEQRELIAFLVARHTAEDEEFKDKLARKIDDSNPANWMTFEELENAILSNTGHGVPAAGGSRSDRDYRRSTVEYSQEDSRVTWQAAFYSRAAQRL